MIGTNVFRNADIKVKDEDTILACKGQAHEI